LKGDNIRLQYVNFSYLFPGNNKTFFDQVRLYFNIANMGLIWRANNQKIDPDYPYGNAPSTSFSLGINVNF
jgi:hypothetical protein